MACPMPGRWGARSAHGMLGYLLFFVNLAINIVVDPDGCSRMKMPNPLSCAAFRATALQATGACGLGILIVGAVGCDKKPTYSTFRLAGTVTVDGKALESGTIHFVAREKDHGTGVSAPIVAGRYEATVPQGPAKVLFHATKETGKTVLQLGKPFPESINLIPPAYRAGVPLDVQSDHDAQDFKLRSR